MSDTIFSSSSPAYLQATVGNCRGVRRLSGRKLFWLENRFPGLEFDASSKSQSAPGLDIDVRTPDGNRVSGEVKTVDPYNQKDFGANQRAAFFKDFSKLAGAAADHKYLFLTEPRAFDVVKAKYQKQLAGVTVVCLVDGREFTA